MENNGNQNFASSLCKAGCGFFGTAQYDGMCSKCYKESVKRKQASPNDSSTAIITTTESVSLLSPAGAVAAACLSSVPDTTPSVETALPTIPSIPVRCEPVSAIDTDSASPSTASGEEENGRESPSKSRKRNRCNTCKKKVGLTGFECRCGGVYCSIHRYSDKHCCEFDYKEHGADHIRKNNPVVVGSKVQKL